MATYERAWGGTIGIGETYGTITITFSKFSVPAGEKFKRFKVAKGNNQSSIILRGDMNSVGWNTWSTDTSKISWSDGTTAKIKVYNTGSTNYSEQFTLTFETETLPTRTVTCVSNGNGTLSASPSSTYEGNTVTLTATPSTGYQLSSYSSSPSVTITNNKFTMPNKAVTVTATFAKKSYTVTLTASPAGGGTVSGGGSKQYQSSVTITATPATGYHFVRWTASAGTLANSTSATTTFTVPASNATITATFAKNTYTLTLNKSPTEGGEVVGAGTYNHGTVVTITAVPADGYYFDEWNASTGFVANSKASQTTYTITSNASITATFLQAITTTHIHSGDITWETGDGYISITCNMINESQLSQGSTASPATIILKLGIVE